MPSASRDAAMRLVAFVNGLVLLAVAGLMLAVGLIFPDPGQVFVLSALFVAVVGGSMALAVLGFNPGEFRRSHTFVLTSTVWLSASFAGALPLYFWGLSPVDAIFEGVSGITTTGSTVMTGLDDLPRGILMWRAIMQGLGGIGFVVAGMAFLPILRVGGMQLFRTESSDRGGKEFATARAVALATLAVYLVLIGLCILAYMLGGMTPFDAVAHALTTISTGGFANYDASFGYFTSAWLQWTAIVFMLAGGLPFMWYLRAIRARSFASEQVALMLKTLGVVIALMTLWLWWSSERGFGEALRLVAFNVVSIVTTTGYSTADYQLWGGLAVVVFFGLTAVGGTTGSTSGGAKAMRWIIMARAIRVGIRRVAYPHGIFTIRYEGRRVDQDVVEGVMSFFTFFFLSVGAMALALSMMGLDLETALSGALTAIANVGPGIGDTIGPAGSFASLEDGPKLLLALGMYVGRLEMMTVYALLLPALWRDL